MNWEYSGFISHPTCHSNWGIWGFSLVCCSVVPAADFDCMWALSSAALPGFCWKHVLSSHTFISILGHCSSPGSAPSPRSFPLGYRGLFWIPGLWQHLLSVVSVPQQTASWSWAMRVTRAQTTEKQPVR